MVLRQADRGRHARVGKHAAAARLRPAQDICPVRLVGRFHGENPLPKS